VRAPTVRGIHLADSSPRSPTSCWRRAASNTYPKGSIVIFVDDEVRHILVVRSGHLKVAVTSVDGRERVLDVLGPGELIGALSIFDGKASLGTMTSITEVDLGDGHGHLPVVLDAHPSATMELLRWMSARVRSASQRQIEFGTTDASAGCAAGWSR
jgi:CRP/FNR family cyclic AMP-dependent transcriptional regulator